jgi:putative aldouronate transport system substrate-binding protein
MKLKITAVVLSLVLGLSPVFSGGGGDKGGGGGISVLYACHQYLTGIDHLKWLKNFEKDAGVSVKIQRMMPSEWGEKKSVLFASRSIPDVIIHGATGGDLITFKGLFEELTPLIANHAPNIQKMFAERPELKLFVQNDQGEIYGTPTYVASTAQNQSNPAMTVLINQLWLERTGKKMPATWTELKDALAAFRDNDVNQNGRNDDEFPMASLSLESGYFSWYYLLGGLGIPISNVNSSGGFFVEDSRVKFVYADERFKTFCKFLRDCYAERLIPRDAFSQDFNQYLAKLNENGDTALTGVIFNFKLFNPYTTKIGKEYAELPPMRASADFPEPFFADDTFSLSYLSSTAAVISAQSKNKIGAMKFIDQFYDPINSLQVYAGDISDSPDPIRGGVARLPGGGYEAINPRDYAGAMQNARTYQWGDHAPLYLPQSVMDLFMTEEFRGHEDWASGLKSVYRDQLKRYNETNTWPGPFLKFTSDESKRMMTLGADMGRYVGQYAKWASGLGDIDADWDGYVQSFREAGLDEAIAIRQAAYDRYIKQLHGAN